MVQSPLFFPESKWKPRPVHMLPHWKNADRVAIDVETYDPYLKQLGPGVRRGGYMVGISFAIEHGPAFYLPIAHEGGGNLDKEKVFEYLGDQAKAFKGELVTANGNYDYDYMAEIGVNFNPSWYRDVLLAEPILDENQFSYSLDNVAKRHGFVGKKEEELIKAVKAFGFKEKDAKKVLWKLPARYIGPYAEEDAALPLKLLRVQEKLIDEQNLRQTYNMESRLMPVLLKMRRRGVRIDQDHLDMVEAWTVREETEALETLTEKTGIRITTKDTNRPVVIAALFETVGIKLPLTVPKDPEKTGIPSIRKEVLDALPKNPITSLYKRARKFNKIRTTFVESVRANMVNGRLHCTFNQLKRDSDKNNDLAGTITGRLSCANPNIQQQPNRDEETAGIWRSIYAPDIGGMWACLDYSQQEPRWITHYAAITGLMGGAEAAQRFIDDPNTDFHQMMSDITGIKRKIAKNILLGLCYGMGGAKLCTKYLDLPTEWVRLKSGRMWEKAGKEGQKILDQFNSRLPFISLLKNNVEEIAGIRGFIKTIYGRICHFPKDKSGQAYEDTFKALNKLIQGSSADQMKKAMVEADDAGIEIQTQVHDELNFTFYDMKEVEALKDIMENGMPAVLPHKVDAEIGPSWGRIKELISKDTKKCRKKSKYHYLWPGHEKEFHLCPDCGEKFKKDAKITGMELEFKLDKAAKKFCNAVKKG